ncbi:MAG TPA: class I SAM-dependent methyltransferase [Bacteroidetes bacterium]|nr:class I SAM-dependent methyltransferase [Bacteroidota bacterium]
MFEGNDYGCINKRTYVQFFIKFVYQVSGEVVYMKKKSMNVFLQTAVAERYDQYYLSESGKTVDRYEKELFRRRLENIPRVPMLELGCGTGHWTRFFADCGFQVTAVDNSEPMMALAKKKNIRNTSFIQADVRQLPFAGHSFQVVTAVTLLEFVSETEKVMEEIDRVLVPGGWLLLGCLNALSELGKKKDADEVFRYARFFSPVDLKKFLNRFGDPFIEGCVHFSENFELLDHTPAQDTVHPAFLVAAVKKTTKLKDDEH